ncbi:MAG: hypothetical protein L6437_05770 [Kiritimatiellae bacterium]|nr:hypothetical protein [Verrucomicrobiota bacterium]MBU4285856.1 hypothetical protein [Verrucomicrobiota bacterium]MBU4365568.1 hypothetical protein [Verrucomicrobiota bacterium]MCG2659735.1 hypothetical protein [Kiritimatiellia bacterium]
MNNTPTIVAADGHVHVYPAYDIKAMFCNLIQNLDRLAGLPARLQRYAQHCGQAVATAPALRAGAAGFAESGTIGNGIHKLAFLAESREHDFFCRLKDQDKAIVGHGLEITSGPDPVCVTVSFHEVGRVCLVAGRQIVTRERLEILALAMRAKIPDGLPARDVIQRVVEAGGIPVLAWSPGKWLFARGHLVRDLIESDQGQILRLGDTTLRPTLWPEPRLMKLARARGMTVIPGSDPLPLAGEERYAGTYGFIYQGAFDASQPAVSIGRMLAGPAAASWAGYGLTPVGARCRAWAVVRRLYQLQTTD